MHDAEDEWSYLAKMQLSRSSSEPPRAAILNLLLTIRIINKISDDK